MDAADVMTRLAEVIAAHDRAALPSLRHPRFPYGLVHAGEGFDALAWVWADVGQAPPLGTRPH